LKTTEELNKAIASYKELLDKLKTSDSTSEENKKALGESSSQEPIVPIPGKWSKR
jgi:hypothetical protein